MSVLGRSIMDWKWQTRARKILSILLEMPAEKAASWGRERFPWGKHCLQREFKV